MALDTSCQAPEGFLRWISRRNGIPSYNLHPDADSRRCHCRRYRHCRHAENSPIIKVWSPATLTATMVWTLRTLPFWSIITRVLSPFLTPSPTIRGCGLITTATEPWQTPATSYTPLAPSPARRCIRSLKISTKAFLALIAPIRRSIF